jgi:hypothetical protein
MKHIRKTLQLSPQTAETLTGICNDTGITQSQIVEEALNLFYTHRNGAGAGAGGGGFVPDDSQKLSFFKAVEKERKLEIESALAEHGFNTELTMAELVNLASKLTNKNSETLINEGISFICQKAITNSLVGTANQGSLGAADERIIKSIERLRTMVTNGEYKPRLKKGEDRAILGLSNVAAQAMTSVVTVKNFFNRYPEMVAQLDVTDL